MRSLGQRSHCHVEMLLARKVMSLYQWVTCCVAEPLWFALCACVCCRFSHQVSYRLCKIIIMLTTIVVIYLNNS